MERGFWQARWAEGRIGFHRQDPNPYLERFAETVWGGDVGAGRRVLVPLAGKSVDVVRLADHFDEVIGVEFVADAVERFFAETVGVAPERAGSVWRAPRSEGRGAITMHVRDMLTVDVDDLGGPVDAVWDRAALIALPPETRRRYAERLVALMAPGARGLLVTLDYPSELMNGPPFSVGDAEVLALFSSATRAVQLAREPVITERPASLPEDVPVYTSVWQLTRTL